MPFTGLQTDRQTEKTVISLPAPMVQLDAHPASDQEVVGLIPTGSGTFFCGD